MKQALHIFAKDARRFWPEILASLLITVAFVWIYPINWAPIDAMQQLRVMLANAITVLVPVSWAILIARVIHDESLVGDRQFWITRPYQWPQLLAAKAIFLFVFLYLPILMAHCALLFQAGFSPFSYAHGLLYNLLLLTGGLVLPLVALATITSNFAKMTLTLLGVIVAIIVFAIAGSNRTSASLPNEGNFAFPLFLCSVLAVIILQYASRRTLRSRLLLAGVFLGIIASATVSPYARLIPRAYPRPTASDHPPVQLSLDPDLQAFVAGIPDNQKELALTVPLLVSDVAPGTAIKTDNVMVTIEAPNGLHWISPWRSTYVPNYLPSTRRSNVSTVISRSFYDQVKSMPLTVRLTFALTRLRAGAATTVPLAEGDVSIPGFGICTLSDFSLGSLQCRFPMRNPSVSLVTSVLSKAPCSSVSSSEQDSLPAQGWSGSLDDSPAQFGITSVWESGIFLGHPGDELPAPDFYRHHKLCQGSPLTVTRYKVDDRTQTDLTITDVKIVYRSRDSFSVGTVE